MLRRITDYVQAHGLRHTLHRAGEKAAERVLHRYHRQWLALRCSEAALTVQRGKQPDAGLISVVIPVYNTDPGMLLALAQSLTAQTYKRWEACLYDGCSTRSDTRAMLERIAGMDSRIRVARGDVNDGISGNTNRAVAMARGDYCALCDHDDLLAPDALWRVAEAIACTGADMLYSDEDKVTEDGRWHTDPHLKPDFGPDTLRSGNYICHLMVLRTVLIQTVGGLRPAFDGSQDHDLALRCSEQAQRIVHLPHILYHWRTVGASMSHQRLAVCMDAACRAVTEQMMRIGYPGEAAMERGVIRLRYRVPQGLTVRVLLLCADPAQPGPPVPEALTQTGAAVERVYLWDLEALNRAAQAAAEDLLLILDEAAVPSSAGFLHELAMYAQRCDVGAVTPVLLRPSKPAVIAAAGLAVMQNGRVAPRHAGQPFAGGGHRAQALTSHNVSAVPPVCFMLRRDHFVPFEGPLDNAFTVRWCRRLAERGLHHVYTPHAAVLLREKRSLWHALPDARLPQGFVDPCISPYYTAGDRADLKLRKGALHHAAD